ncbi:hypothetical protein [Mucilaginibacter sp.]|uniref:hypothetical protein n=1 Tax=Mucilaginibacter sp. TaxID=1882438 RepID=UPI00283E8B3D|nr:hypothetical protein [Mucilaginibacter sp.]MDR3694686.1 hypothetical protein [Mucilaginibacter sp.]
MKFKSYPKVQRYYTSGNGILAGGCWLSVCGEKLSVKKLTERHAVRLIADQHPTRPAADRCTACISETGGLPVNEVLIRNYADSMT